MKKRFPTTIQKYIENIMNRPNFEIALMSLRRGFTKAQERRTTSSFNLVQDDWMADYSESKLGWELVDTSLSKIHQTAYYMGFISGLEGGHNCLTLNLGNDPCITSCSHLLCELEHRPVWRRICFQKFIWGKGKLFPPALCWNKLGCWLSHLHQWRTKESCLPSDGTAAQTMA